MSRVCLIVGAICLFVAAVVAFGVLHIEGGEAGFALVGFGLWCLSGAV